MLVDKIAFLAKKIGCCIAISIPQINLRGGDVAVAVAVAMAVALALARVCAVAVAVARAWAVAVARAVCSRGWLR